LEIRLLVVYLYQKFKTKKRSMDLVTLKLASLGEGCIVANAAGNEFLDLSKVRAASKSDYNGEWELAFTVSATRDTTATGKRKLKVCESQTEDERKAKAPIVYYGNGIRLFEDRLDGAQESTPTPKPMPQVRGTGLPY